MPARAAKGERVWILTHPFDSCAAAMGGALERQFRARTPRCSSVVANDLFVMWLPSSSVLGRFAGQHTEGFMPAIAGDFAVAVKAAPDSPVLRELADGGAARFTTAVTDGRPDVIVSVSSFVGAIAAEFSPSMVRTVTVHTGFDLRGAWIHPSADLHVVSTKEMREDLVVQGVAWDRVLVAGVIAPLALPMESVMNPGERFRVVVSADAAPADPCAMLSTLGSAGVSVDIVSSGVERADKRAFSTVGQNRWGRTLKTSDEVAEAIAGADLVVVRPASRSLAQALAAGRPCLIYYPEVDTEIYNVDFLVNTGAALRVRDDDDLLSKVRFLSVHRHRLEQLRGQACELASPVAGLRVCERVLAMR